MQPLRRVLFDSPSPSVPPKSMQVTLTPKAEVRVVKPISTPTRDPNSTFTPVSSYTPLVFKDLCASSPVPLAVAAATAAAAAAKRVQGDGAGNASESMFKAAELVYKRTVREAARSSTDIPAASALPNRRNLTYSSATKSKRSDYTSKKFLRDLAGQKQGDSCNSEVMKPKNMHSVLPIAAMSTTPVSDRTTSSRIRIVNGQSLLPLQQPKFLSKQKPLPLASCETLITCAEPDPGRERPSLAFHVPYGENSNADETGIEQQDLRANMKLTSEIHGNFDDTQVDISTRVTETQNGLQSEKIPIEKSKNLEWDVPESQAEDQAKLNVGEHPEGSTEEHSKFGKHENKGKVTERKFAVKPSKTKTNSRSRTVQIKKEIHINDSTKRSVQSKRKTRLSEVLKLQKALETAFWTDSKKVQKQTEVIIISDDDENARPSHQTPPLKKVLKKKTKKAKKIKKTKKMSNRKSVLTPVMKSPLKRSSRAKEIKPRMFLRESGRERNRRSNERKK